MRETRAAIAAGRFAEFYAEKLVVGMNRQARTQAMLRNNELRDPRCV